MRKIKQNNRGLDEREMFFTKDGFCAIDICVDLKKLGFNEWCFGQRSYRDPENGMIKKNCHNEDYGIDPYCGEEIMLCAVPMHQQVQKWLLEEYRIFLNVDLVFENAPHMKGDSFSAWSYYKWKAYDSYDCELESLSEGLEDMSYEEAMDHGIRSCLDEIMRAKELEDEAGDLLG